MPLNCKNYAQNAWKLKRRKGTKGARLEVNRHKQAVGVPQAARDRGSHHRQPVVVGVSASLHFASLLRCLLFLDRGTCHGLSVLGVFRPLLLSLIHMTSK